MNRLLIRSAVVLALLSVSAPAPASELALVSGRFGKALDVSRSPVEVAGDPAFRGSPLTVECWALLRSKDDFNVLVASDHRTSGLHWGLKTLPKSGHFAADLTGYEPSRITSAVDICDGRWHHVAMTHDGGRVRLFVDGRPAAEVAVRRKREVAPEPGPLTIGQAVVDLKTRLGCDGLIDELRISSVIRPIEGLPAEPPELDQETVGLWRFDHAEAADVDPAWTPRPAVGDAPPWEKATDKDWIDGRLSGMDTGPFFGATLRYPGRSGPVTSFRGTAVKLDGGGVIFDRNRLRLAAGWTGGFLKHSSRRFGLLNTPTPEGETVFTTPADPGWAVGPNPGPATAPLPRERARFRGTHVHGERVVFAYEIRGIPVLDSPAAEPSPAGPVVTRTVQIAHETEDGQGYGPMTLTVAGPPDDASRPEAVDLDGLRLLTFRGAGGLMAVAASGGDARLEFRDGNVVAVVPVATARFKLWLWRGDADKLADFAASVRRSDPAEDLSPLTRPGPRRWGEPLVTSGEVAADDAAYVVDTLTIPYDNPFGALFFVGGVDFLPDGRAAICTAHGDVWLIGGIDERLERLTWQRFATGLYQPLGLKVVDGNVVVLERGQLTRLHDIDGDGEADFYECLCDDWHVGGGEHSFHTCLETDPEGNFYFFTGGDTHTPNGGCLMRVASDGSKAEVFSTGFRHPIGLGASPDGRITGADQEGNWVPATRIDIYQRGGFYGDMRAHHRDVKPETFDPPLCWLPRQMDNSAGGQVWAPGDAFGPLSGRMLHLSFGKCRALLVMPQRVGDVWQAGAVDLGLQFLAGVARGRARPGDGHLYVVGLNGWQTAATRDGCVQRVRFTGRPVTMPVGLSVHEDGVRLEFSGPLDPATAADPGRWSVSRWNYRWSADYGSKRWSVDNPDRVGEDAVLVKKVQPSSDGRRVFLRIDDMKPVMQMEVRFDVAAIGGPAVRGVINHTIHGLERAPD